MIVIIIMIISIIIIMIRVVICINISTSSLLSLTEQLAHLRIASSKFNDFVANWFKDLHCYVKITLILNIKVKFSAYFHH